MSLRELWFSAEEVESLLDNPIAYHRVFADIAGNASGAIFLSQLYYWTKHTKNPDGWVYKTSQDWSYETGLTRREIDTARKALKANGIITEKLAGVPPTVYYKIEKREFYCRLKLATAEHLKRRTNQFGGKRQIQTESHLAENAKLNEVKAPNQIGGKRPNISETSSDGRKTDTTITSLHCVVCCLDTDIPASSL